MNAQKTLSTALLVGVLALTAYTGMAQAGEEHQDGAAEAAQREEVLQARKGIDRDSKAAIRELIASNDRARQQYDRAAGYAVFRATKAGFLLTGAGGSGVAVNRQTDERTYMRMGSGGVGIGAGLQNYRLVVLFETTEALDRFIDGGWDAATSAQAAAGKAGLNAASSFVDGIAIHQLTDKGLMAQADLTGTRFWASNALNSL